MVGGGGFEPPKSLTTDLQSVPFGRSGTLPKILSFGAGDWNWTRNLLITNQLLCQLSYASAPAEKINVVPRGGIEPPTRGFSVPCSTYWATEASQFFMKMLVKITSIFIWRPEGGSNPWPPAWQAGVLTNCTTGPYIFKGNMVGLHGLEPRTNRLWADRSNQLS